jgi:hypothetical protein
MAVADSAAGGNPGQHRSHRIDAKAGCRMNQIGTGSLLLVATLAMCGPTAVLAYYVSRLLARSGRAQWLGIVQAALIHYQ